MCSFVGTVLLIRKATLGHKWLRGESRKQELHHHQWTDERVDSLLTNEEGRSAGSS